MAKRTVAGTVKKNAESDGVIVFADETGFMMNPGIKKTWAPAGKTPVIVYRNRHHRKVSVLGALACQPGRNSIEVVCDFNPDAYVRAPQAAAFVHRLLAEYPGRRIDLIWDNLSAHRSVLVKELQSLGLSVEAITDTGEIIRFGKEDDPNKTQPKINTGLTGIGEKI